MRSAGTDVYEEEPNEQAVTEDLIAWADVVFVMEQYHLDVLEDRFPGTSEKVVVLDIPDRFYRGDPELIRLLQMRLSVHTRRA